MSHPKKSTAAPALVVGIFLFILGIAATAWWFSEPPTTTPGSPPR